MSSAFWLNQEEEDDYDDEIPFFSQESAFATSQPDASQQTPQQQCCCEHCGSTREFYTTAEGETSCADCFHTQGKANQDDVVDHEQATALAAQTRRGTFKRYQKNVGGKGSRRKSLAARQAQLEAMDRSVPLPDLEDCLAGMRCVLQRAGNLLDLKLQGKKSRPLLRHLWLAFLRAYSDAAEEHGKAMSTLRFSLRDEFLSVQHKTMVHRQIAAEALAAQKDQPQQQTSNTNSKKKAVTAKKKTRKRKSPHDAPSEEKTKKSIGIDPPERLTSKLLMAHLSTNRPIGYREAVLKLRPNMELVAAFLYLAAAAHDPTVTTVQITDWINTDVIPLTNAYNNLLTDDLQNKLQPVAHVFRFMKGVLRPETVRRVATWCAVACRLRKTLNGDDTVPIFRQHAGSNATSSKDRLCLWAPQRVPDVVTRMVATAGMGPDVAQQALSLVNLNDHRYPRLNPAAVVTVEDVVAVVALACQQVPSWRRWVYYEETCGAANDDMVEAATKSKRQLDAYIGFLERNVFDQCTNDLWNDFSLLERTLQKRGQQVSNGDNSAEDRSVPVAGIPIPHSRPLYCGFDDSQQGTEEPRFCLLLEWISHRTRIGVDLIRERVRFFAAGRPGFQHNVSI